MTNTLIDKTYFNKQLVIGQTDDETVEQTLNEAILKYESELLLAVLGYDLYKAFYLEMKGENPAQRMRDLAYGKIFDVDYTQTTYYSYLPNNGKSFIYQGLLNNPDNVNLLAFLPNSYEATSPIAKYVYYHYQRNNFTNTMGVGEVTNEALNGTKASPANKMSWAMNTLNDDLVRLYIFLDNFKSVYPEFTIPHCNRWLPSINYNQFNLNYL